MRTLSQDHSPTCRCAKCRQAKALPSITQKMGGATSENYADFEVEPFASFDAAAESPTWMGNELVDEQEAEYGRRRQPPRRGMQSRARPASRRVRRQPQGRRPRRVRRGPAIFAPEPAVIEAPPPRDTQSSEYIRWVQNKLNQLMDLNLPVDGVMGVETRSAIRSFQKQHGLPMDGIVGPPTEAALIAASGGRSPQAQNAAEFEFDGEWLDQELEVGQPKPPSWLIPLKHYLGSASGVVTLKPSKLNPGFIDPDKDELILSSLHTRLRDFFTTPPTSATVHRTDYPAWLAKSGNKLRVALVDLTGSKLHKPDFAGFNSTVPIYAASCAKVAAIYAAHQLRFDLNQLAISQAIKTKDALIKNAGQTWTKIPSSDRPQLTRTFVFQEDPPQPVLVEFRSDFQETLDRITSDPGQANSAVSAVIDRVGFHFVGSAVWQAGLHHPKRGGLWLGSNYRSGDARRSWHGGPVGRLGHGVSALSLVTFYTLLAQNRLVDSAASQDMKSVLALTGSFVEGALRSTGRFGHGADDIIYSKVGYWSKWVHDCALVERKHNSKQLRYALAVLTESPEYLRGAPRILENVIVDMDKLIVANNP